MLSGRTAFSPGDVSISSSSVCSPPCESSTRANKGEHGVCFLIHVSDYSLFV